MGEEGLVSKKAKAILEAFNLAEEEFGEHKSTEFLISIVKDRLGISYEEVVDGLVASAEESDGR